MTVNDRSLAKLDTMATGSCSVRTRNGDSGQEREPELRQIEHL